MCDQDCKNQPCAHGKFTFIFTNITYNYLYILNVLLLVQYLMGFSCNLRTYVHKWDTTITTEDITENVTRIAKTQNNHANQYFHIKHCKT